MARSTTHGGSHSPEYKIWAGIVKRCCNPACKKYYNYGGRGIRVADEWRHDFAAFLAHAGPRPSPEHTIDRIDTDGHYEPGNVRWATRTEQARNRRSNRVIEFQGSRRCMAEWAEIVGIPFTIIQSRICRYGWSVERTLTTPVGHPHARKRRPTSGDTGPPA